MKILICRKKVNFPNYQPSKLGFISLWYKKTWTIITVRISLFGICFVLQPIVWPRPGKEKINRKSKRQQYCTYMLCTKRTSRNCTKFMIGWNAAAAFPPPQNACAAPTPLLPLSPPCQAWNCIILWKGQDMYSYVENYPTSPLLFRKDSDCLALGWNSIWSSIFFLNFKVFTKYLFNF